MTAFYIHPARLLASALLSLLLAPALAQSAAPLETLTLVELNCENLFDCRHDTLKNDLDFTPDGAYHWTRTRYWKKLDAVGRTIVACGGEGTAWRAPDLVALCEVENDTVLHDLTRRSLLRTARYDYVMTASPDLRGIDVALLYTPYAFRLLQSHSIRVAPPPGMRPTRDILYASGTTSSGDTLHVFVVHAPSRYGGERSTRPYRMAVAQRLVAAADSVRAVSAAAHIIIAGDFNDYTGDAAPKHLAACGLRDISARATGSHGARATYRYRGDWRSLDHIFVSPSLAARLAECRVADAPFLLEPDKTYGGVKPRRNFLGPVWRNGFSDHLPLVARFAW